MTETRELPMFRELITNADGSTEEGTCSEDHALSLLRRAVRLGFQVEATRHGGAVIVREIPGSTGTHRHTVALEPVTPAGRLTATVRLDLAIIDRRMGRSLAARLNPVTGRIDAGLNSIPPAAAARLISRGLVTVTDGAVAVSLTARLAMLAQDHRTETRQPRGWYQRSSVDGQPLPGPSWVRARYASYDRSSVASCSCHGWSYPAEDRDDARRRAHGHRQEVTARFVAALAAA